MDRNALTPEQRFAYADLKGILRRVTVRGDQIVPGVDEPILLSGHSPVPSEDEIELIRYGGVLEIAGTFRDDDDGPDTLSMGQIGQAACELLVTNQRLVFSLVNGQTRAGAATDRQVIVVFDYPWELVETIDLPIKTALTDRIAGGRHVGIWCFTAGAANLKFLPSSELSPLPRSQPIRKVKSDEAMRTLVMAAARWRLERATGDEVPRLTRVLGGAYVEEDGNFVAYLVDPEDQASEQDEATVEAAIEESAAHLAPPPVEEPTTGQASLPVEEPPPPVEEPTPEPEPRLRSPSPPPLPPSPPPSPPALSPETTSTPGAHRNGRILLIALAAVLLVAAGAGGAVLATRGSDSETAPSVTTSAAAPSPRTAPPATPTTEATIAEVPEDTTTTIDDTAIETNTTEVATETETQTETKPAPEPEPEDAPIQALREHLERLNAGNYSAAFGLMSDSYRAKVPNWPTVRATANPSITIGHIGPADITNGAADVRIVFYARDRHPTHGSDTECRRFSGTAHLVRQGGVWRYDPLNNDLDAAVEPDSNPSCP